MKRVFSIIVLSTALILPLTLFSSAQLDESYEAHGGLETFQKYGGLEYDQQMVISGVINVSDNQVFDLKSRKALITSDKYTVGFDGNEAWITPNVQALGIPPRFYALTPFYFFGLPFLFADPGVNIESLGTKELNGTQYNVIKVTYDPGIGDTPDDDYVVYLDKDTNQIKLVHYIVTYPPLMQGKSVDELERHAAVYEEWQEVGGLVVPKKLSFYEWSDDQLGDSARGYMTFEDVTFSVQTPDPKIFEMPDGAVVDNSHKAQ
ncbi:MAG: DUF6503 family protein [Thermodesulfobacteriota bacterium]